jgi:polypeptide N-acetylgalactosaminyltransferase
MIGPQVATGETLTFLDSHIDASEGWLEYSMDRIADDPKHVVMPIIDSLSRNMVYTAGGIELVGFNTHLVQTKPNQTKPKKMNLSNVL